MRRAQYPIHVLLALAVLTLTVTSFPVRAGVLDQSLWRAIAQRSSLSRAQVAQLKQCRACFLSPAAYEARLRSAYPSLSAAQRQRIVGDYLGRPYVRTGTKGIPTTVAHERLHPLLSRQYQQSAGRRLSEGTVEHLAQKIHRIPPIRNYPAAYADERQIIGMLESKVGERAIQRAAFAGEMGPIRSALQTRRGRDQWPDLVKAVEQGDFASARRIIHTGGR